MFMIRRVVHASIISCPNSGKMWKNLTQPSNQIIGTIEVEYRNTRQHINSSYQWRKQGVHGGTAVALGPGGSLHTREEQINIGLILFK